MKVNKIIYWASTIIVAGLFLMSGFMDLIHAPQLKEGFKVLGYPEYLLDILGTAKMLGVIAILQPRYTKLKEWAYAGFTFNMTGAMWSHIVTGTPFAMIIVLLILLATSYICNMRIQRAKDLI